MVKGNPAASARYFMPKKNDLPRWLSAEEERRLLSLAGSEKNPDGLGKEIYAGINLRNSVRIYAGAIPAAMLAIAADVCLGGVQKKMKMFSLQR